MLLIADYKQILSKNNIVLKVCFTLHLIKGMHSTLHSKPSTSDVKVRKGIGLHANLKQTISEITQLETLP